MIIIQHILRKVHFNPYYEIDSFKERQQIIAVNSSSDPLEDFDSTMSRLPFGGSLTSPGELSEPCDFEAIARPRRHQLQPEPELDYQHLVAYHRSQTSPGDLSFYCKCDSSESIGESPLRCDRTPVGQVDGEDNRMDDVFYADEYARVSGVSPSVRDVSVFDAGTDRRISTPDYVFRDPCLDPCLDPINVARRYAVECERLHSTRQRSPLPSAVYASDNGVRNVRSMPNSPLCREPRVRTASPPNSPRSAPLERATLKPFVGGHRNNSIYAATMLLDTDPRTRTAVDSDTPRSSNNTESSPFCRVFEFPDFKNTDGRGYGGIVSDTNASIPKMISPTMAVYRKKGYSNILLI